MVAAGVGILRISLVFVTVDTSRSKNAPRISTFVEPGLSFDI